MGAGQLNFLDDPRQVVKSIIKTFLMALIVAGAVLFGEAATPWSGQAVFAQTQGQVPGRSIGGTNDSEFWRAIRQGVTGSVSLPNKQAGVLVQSEGDNWRAINNGPLKKYGAWVLAAIAALLIIFFLVRGRVKVDSGLSGRTFLRFDGLDRFAHWLTASSFILLGLTGLNIMYGRYFLKPLIGPDAFATLTYYGKVSHDYVGFAFAVGIVLMFALWVKDNLPDRHDIGWILNGGGLIGKHNHPPAGRFNFGQKFIFWTVIIGGALLTITGLTLLFPFYWTDMAGMHLVQLIHAAIAVIMIAIIIAHIYIGSLGMEGAFDAMGSGMVDENWAREHHSAWVEEVEAADGTTVVQES
jgi:formate dehydrogenase subunit gamma